MLMLSKCISLLSSIYVTKLLTNVDSVQVRKVVVVADGPREQLRWLRHGGRINPVSSSVGSDELVETECWHLLLQSKCPCNGVERKEKQSMICVRPREEMMHCWYDVAYSWHLETFCLDVRHRQ
jgi:hypothetical protein